MENDTVVESVTKEQSYVVPIYLLSAIILNTDNPDSINSDVIGLLEEVSKSEKIKKVFAETSKNLSDEIAKIKEGMNILLVPNTMIPVKDKQDSDIAIEFVEQFNKALAAYMEQENEK